MRKNRNERMTPRILFTHPRSVTCTIFSINLPIRLRTIATTEKITTNDIVFIANADTVMCCASQVETGSENCRDSFMPKNRTHRLTICLIRPFRSPKKMLGSRQIMIIMSIVPMIICFQRLLKISEMSYLCKA